MMMAAMTSAHSQPLRSSTRQSKRLSCLWPGDVTLPLLLVLALLRLALLWSLEAAAVGGREGAGVAAGGRVMGGLPGGPLGTMDRYA